jgi:hypothetical protein
LLDYKSGGSDPCKTGPCRSITKYHTSICAAQAVVPLPALCVPVCEVRAGQLPNRGADSLKIGSVGREVPHDNLGHVAIQMTFDVYGHLWAAADDDQAAMTQLQARLVG